MGKQLKIALNAIKKWFTDLSNRDIFVTSRGVFYDSISKTS